MEPEPTSPPPRLGQPGLLTLQQVADRLRVSRTTVRRLVQRGELVAHRAGGTYRFTSEAVLDLLDATDTAGSRPT